METTETIENQPHPLQQTAFNVAHLAREIFMRNVEFGITATDVETVIKKSYTAAAKFDAYTENFLSKIASKNLTEGQADEKTN